MQVPVLATVIWLPPAHVKSHVAPEQKTEHLPLHAMWHTAPAPQLIEALAPAVRLHTVLTPLHAALPLSPVLKVQVAPS